MKLPGGGTALGRAANFNTVVAIGFVGLGLLLLAIIPDQVDRPLMLFGQAPSGLNPQLFPQLVASGFLLLGLCYLVRSFRMSEPNGFRRLTSESIVNVTVTLGALLIFALSMVPLGFLLSSVLLIAVLSTFYGNRNILLGVLVSVLVPTAIFLVFTRLLHVSLPESGLF